MPNKSMPRGRGVASRVFFVGCLQLACSSGSESGLAVREVGAETTLAIVRAPADASCLEVVVSGASTFKTKLDLSPGETTRYKLSGLPVGPVVFVASAFGSACKAVSASSVAAYVSDPLSVELRPGANPAVSLVMHAQASTSVSVDFPETAPTCTPAGGVCSEGSQCCSQRCDQRDGQVRGAGSCGDDKVLAGPLATLPAATKRADFRLTPPAVQSTFASAAPDGTTNVSVVFGADSRLKTLQQLVLPLDEGKLVLSATSKTPSKDGSREFTGNVPMLFADVLATQLLAQKVATRNKETEIVDFRGREIVGKRTRPEIIDSGRIPLLPWPLRQIDENRSLMVTDESVTADPTRTFDPCTGVGAPLGAWTFGRLMTDMAGSMNPGDFAEAWLTSYQSAHTVNHFNVAAQPSLEFPAKTLAQVLADWPRLSDGSLDLAQAPFQLDAIVNRADLAANHSYGEATGAEGRFVFHLVDPLSSTCTELPLHVIFEYGVPISTCSGLRDWAQAWLTLGTISLGTPEFNTALQALTDQFATAGADPSKPNESALNQFRSNAFVGLASGVDERWELREFHLFQDGANPAQLHQSTIAQTPDGRYNGHPPIIVGSPGPRAPQLGEWILENISATADLLDPVTYTVPLPLPCPLGSTSLPCAGFAFRGGATFNSLDYWDAPGPSTAALAVFGLNTCDGCHGRETGTSFVMVRPNGNLSSFLTGRPWPDQRDPSITHTFNDFLRRKGSLLALAGAFCGKATKLPDSLVGTAFSSPIPPLETIPILATH